MHQRTLLHILRVRKQQGLFILQIHSEGEGKCGSDIEKPVQPKLIVIYPLQLFLTVNSTVYQLLQ